jgi:glycosyltransferase involved in cell wall biosynthesis
MRIGIDAKWLFRGPPSGRRVVRHLVEGLAQVASGDELHLFLDARSRSDRVPLPVPAERQHFVWARNNQIANLWAVPRAADRLGLDAVVYQNFAPPRLVAHHARIAFVYDVIFESHPEFFTRRERLYFASLRRLTASADGVCTLSASERERLVRLRYAASDRVAVVPIAVDPAFVPRDAQGRDAIERVLATFGVRWPFVLFAGRLNVRKNVAALVRAMALVRFPGMTLAVVGAATGPAQERLVGVAAEAGVTDRVRWLGAVSDEDLRALRGGHLVLFPLV